MTNWDFLLYGTNGSVENITDLTNASGRQLTVSLDDASSAKFSLSGFNPESLLVREFETDLVILRNGQKLFRGRVGSSTDTVDSSGHRIDFSCWDYRELLFRRILLGDETLEFTAVDQELIAWTLIDDAQSKDYGNMGITRGSGQTTGITRDVLYEAGQKIGDRISNIAHSDDGFEWEIDPDLVFRVYYPLRGDQLSDFILELGGSVLSVRRQVDANNFANVIRLHGGIPQLPDPPELLGYSQSGSGFFTQDELYRYAVSAILPEGETKISDEKLISISQAGSTNSVVLDWAAIDRATGYNIYGRNRNDDFTVVNTSTSSTTGGTLLGNTTYKYAVSYVGPYGESKVTTENITTTAGTNTNQILIEWFPRSGATSYRVYGRGASDTLELLSAQSPQNGNVGTQSFTDNGSVTPSGLPDTPFPMSRIATNVQTTTWTDSGESTPSGAVPTGVPSVLTSIAVASDIGNYNAGRFAVNISDQDLLRQTAVDARALWYLSEHATVQPSYTVVLEPAMWRGPLDLWVGDAPTLNIVSGRLNVDTQDLRVTEMSFTIDDNGAETIQVTLGPRSRSIFEQILQVKSQLDVLGRH